MDCADEHGLIHGNSRTAVATGRRGDRGQRSPAMGEAGRSFRRSGRWKTFAIDPSGVCLGRFTPCFPNCHSRSIWSL